MPESRATQGPPQLQAKAGLNPQTGRLDAPTLQALDVAAAGKLKFPPFDKLFADGKLNSTIAIGYDEAGTHRSETREVVKGLLGDGTPGNPGQAALAKELNPTVRFALEGALERRKS